MKHFAALVIGSSIMGFCFAAWKLMGLTVLMLMLTFCFVSLMAYALGALVLIIIGEWHDDS